MEFWLCCLLLFIAVAVFFTSQAFQFYAVYKPNQNRNEKNNIMYAYPFQGLQSLIYIHLYTHRVNSSTYIHNVDDDDDEQLSEHERTTSFYIIERTQHTTESATTAPAPATEQTTSEQEKHTRREREPVFKCVSAAFYGTLANSVPFAREKESRIFFCSSSPLSSVFPFSISAAVSRNASQCCLILFHTIQFWIKIRSVSVSSVLVCLCNVRFHVCMQFAILSIQKRTQPMPSTWTSFYNNGSDK